MTVIPHHGPLEFVAIEAVDVNEAGRAVGAGCREMSFDKLPISGTSSARAESRDHFLVGAFSAGGL
jgi:hypothetical protein